MSFITRTFSRLFSSTSSSGKSASAFIQEELGRGKKVTLFIKRTCPYCHQAQSLFKSIYGSAETYEEKVNVIDIGGRSDVQAELGHMTGASTVPRVFIDKQCIGGYDNTAQLNKSGELRKLLESNTVASHSA